MDDSFTMLGFNCLNPAVNFFFGCGFFFGGWGVINTRVDCVKSKKFKYLFKIKNSKLKIWIQNFISVYNDMVPETWSNIYIYIYILIPKFLLWIWLRIVTEFQLPSPVHEKHLLIIKWSCQRKTKKLLCSQLGTLPTLICNSSLYN